ncbi:MAG TPA: HNH endonuclease family protein [Candidatus Paceibacterota bacterium]|nr:HNH endonuclease family protein [Candidatus Paceibacterota bacterium]
MFLFDGRRSNAGKSSFHRWASEIFSQSQTLSHVTAWVHDLTRYYATEESFNGENATVSNWYGSRHLLKYTLFEYELHLLTKDGKGKAPHLKWEQLSDSTIEHILPQTPDDNSHWIAVWSKDEMKTCLHDIANLVLTQNNSNYLNFEFVRKKGLPGQSPSYSNSDIRQERKISGYSDWTPKEFGERRKDLVEWINERWKTAGGHGVPALELSDEADEDSAR